MISSLPWASPSTYIKPVESANNPDWAPSSTYEVDTHPSASSVSDPALEIIAGSAFLGEVSVVCSWWPRSVTLKAMMSSAGLRYSYRKPTPVSYVSGD
jgi:hypothetical protein